MNTNIQTLKGRVPTTVNGLLWTFVGGFLTLIGLAGFIYYLIHGHAAYNTFRQVPWGIHVGAYEFFVSVSAGLAIVGSAGVYFKPWNLEKFAKRSLIFAFAALFAGFFVLLTEIGYPIRMLIYTVLSPNPKAALFWMGMLYGLYMFVMGVQLLLLLLGQEQRSRIWALLTIAVAVLALGNVGTVFAYLGARPFWHGAFLPPYIVLTAVIAGLGLLFVLMKLRYQSDAAPSYVQGITERAGQLFVLLLVVLAFFELSKILVGIYGQYPGKYEATMLLLNGPLAFNFWVFEILVGIALPIGLVLLGKAKSLFLNTVAGVCAVVGMFFMRYDMVIAGQLVPLRSDVYTVGTNGLLSYSPSLTEIAIIVGAFGMCVLLYIAANMIFKLDADER